MGPSFDLIGNPFAQTVWFKNGSHQCGSTGTGISRCRTDGQEICLEDLQVPFGGGVAILEQGHGQAFVESLDEGFYEFALGDRMIDCGQFLGGSDQLPLGFGGCRIGSSDCQFGSIDFLCDRGA